MNMEENNNILQITGLTKHYSDFSLQDLNLELPYGCIMGLMGENGAGKSTAIKAILGLIRPDGGTVHMFGEEVREDGARLREQVGTVLEGLNLPGTFNGMEIDRMMSGIYKRWDSRCFRQYLERFDVGLKKKIKDYSRGMKIKVSLAIALSHEARLLILDEPTSGLDPVIREEVLDMLREFVMDEEHSVLISSHIISDLEKTADYAAFIHKGKLILCEEKDRLQEEYRMIKGSREAIRRLETEGAIAVEGLRENCFGADALVRIKKMGRLANDVSVEPAGLEDIMIYLVKAEAAR